MSVRALGLLYTSQGCIATFGCFVKGVVSEGCAYAMNGGGGDGCAIQSREQRYSKQSKEGVIRQVQYTRKHTVMPSTSNIEHE